jgi:hypothetical protein
LIVDLDISVADMTGKLPPSALPEADEEKMN